MTAIDLNDRALLQSLRADAEAQLACPGCSEFWADAYRDIARALDRLDAMWARVEIGQAHIVRSEPLAQAKPAPAVEPWHYSEGVEVDRLMRAITVAGAACNLSREEVAAPAGMANAVNLLSLAVTSIYAAPAAPVQVQQWARVKATVEHMLYLVRIDNEEALPRSWDELRKMCVAAPAAPAPVPLTDEQLEAAYRSIWRNKPAHFGFTTSDWITAGIRYAEQAHGIGKGDEA